MKKRKVASMRAMTGVRVVRLSLSIVERTVVVDYGWDMVWSGGWDGCVAAGWGIYWRLGGGFWVSFSPICAGVVD